MYVYMYVCVHKRQKHIKHTHTHTHTHSHTLTHSHTHTHIVAQLSQPFRQRHGVNKCGCVHATRRVRFNHSRHTKVSLFVPLRKQTLPTRCKITTPICNTCLIRTYKSCIIQEISVFALWRGCRVKERADDSGKTFREQR